MSSRPLKRGDVVSMVDGRMYLVWGVTADICHLMLTRNTRVGAGDVLIAGRIQISGGLSDSAESVYLQTASMRHILRRDLCLIGVASCDLLHDVAAERLRQSVEIDARAAPQRTASITFARLTAAGGGVPTADYMARRAAADAAALNGPPERNSSPPSHREKFRKEAP